MGYTHYFKRQRNISNEEANSLFKAYAVGVEKIVQKAHERGIAIADRFGERIGVEILDDYIAFNGLDEESCETFLVRAMPEPYNPERRWEDQDWEFNFCKTRHLPYDEVVTACLILMKDVYGSRVKISSDGEWELDWTEGRELYESAIGEEAKFPFVEEKVVS